MKTATIRDLRYNFPKVEAWLAGGEEIELTKRGRVVGRILPSSGPTKNMKTPDFATRIRAVCGDGKIDTAALLDYNKGRF